MRSRVSDGFNHFYGINSSVVATGAYVHAPEYEYRYKLGKNNALYNPGLDATSCDTYNTTQRLRTCKQGYLDGSNVIKQASLQFYWYRAYLKLNESLVQRRIQPP